MQTTRKRLAIGEPEKGINMTVIIDGKFKTNSFIFRFLNPLTSEKEAARLACVPFMLEDTCTRFPNITDFNMELSRLYGASVRGNVSRCFDSLTISVSGAAIADRYALEGESITLDLLRLLLDCIFDPVCDSKTGFPEKQFALKKQELIDDIESELNDKRTYAINAAKKIIHEGEPTGIAYKGSKEAAMSLVPSDVYNAYKEMLRSAQVEITFVGAELPEECMELIKERFGSISRENVFAAKMLPSPLKEKPQTVTEHMNVVQSKTVMAYKYDKDIPREVINVFSALMGGTPFSMLFKNVREKLSLCYYCADTAKSCKRTFYIDSGVESDKIEAAKTEIERQMSLAAAGDFSDELFEQTKLYLICGLKSIGDKPSKIAEWYLIRCIECGDMLSPKESAERIAMVTRDAVQDAAASMKLDTFYVLTGNAADQKED